MDNVTKGKAIVDFEKIILNIDEVAYNAGEKQGRVNGVEEYKQEIEQDFEKYATSYVIQQFSDCQTLSDFQDKIKWIVARNCNFL